MSTWVFHHEACLAHIPGTGHPESPQRLRVVMEALRQPEFEDLAWREAPAGTREQVLLVHRAEYVDAIAAVAPSSGLVALDGGDTLMSPGSWEAVMRCVGAACAGVDAVLAGEAANVFCATRPCGHHAEPDGAMGFCIFNQAAIAAVHALRTHGLQRVAVIDFDVHHGNGTQAAFYHRPELFFGSSHQSPLYPGTGAASETGGERQHRQPAAAAGLRQRAVPRAGGQRAAAGIAAFCATADHRVGRLRRAPARSPGPHEPGGRGFCVDHA